MSNIYQNLTEFISQGRFAVLETAITGNSGTICSDMHRRIIEVPMDSDETSGQFAKVSTIKSGNGLVIREPIFPQPRMIILGGGHIAVPVCDFAAKVGFVVTVCDDRPDFANRERFPLAADVICDSFQNEIRKLCITPLDYVVVITRGHRHDADCLRVLLNGCMPAYLGMIGSKRRVKGLLEMLSAEGYSQDALNTICTPIGLRIGAVTPEEIAISILAEVIAYKRLPEHQKQRTLGCSQSDIDPEVVRFLADSAEPKAVVTVIETKGSTPRAAGAKMAVSPLGQVTGSIGGGCSESEVIREAIRIIGTKTYKIVEIDLTGEVAESEGMVCGGIMHVLIEDA